MLTYFVQVNVCWLLFYGAYFALLSRETFFRLNRIWLIISLLGGLVLPLIAPSFEVVEPTNVAVVMLQPFVVTAADLSQNLQNRGGVVFKLLTAIYGLGVVFTLSKLLFGFWKIKRLSHQAERLPMEDFTLMQVREAIAPFSFFRWVFINFNLIERTDIEQIILHERAHVRERHSIDVVFVNLLNVVFWWSPLVYFYTKSIKNVHEYAADAAVLRTSSPPQYGRLLLRQQQSGMSLSLTNPFFSQLKKRILMMTRNPSKRRALAKYALALPIFLVLTLLLASPKTRVMATTEAATEKVVSSIETLEKNLTTPESLDDKLVVSTDVLPFYNDTIIQETPQMVFTLDDNTPSSDFMTSVEKFRNRKEFSVGDFVRTAEGKYQRLDNGEFTIVRISRKRETIRFHNVGSAFSDDVLKLVQMAEVGDSYQFIQKERMTIEGKLRKFPTFTYYIGEKPTQPKLEELNSQQQAEFAKIAESPVVLLAGRRGGVIEAKTMADQDHLDAYQVINGQTIPVEIVSFVMFRVPHREDPQQSNNSTGKFNTETKKIIEMATTNDRFQFMSVRCRVKGENTPVDAGSLEFVVKNVPPEYYAVKDSSDPVLVKVDEVAEYVGGRDSLFRFLGRNIKYPAEARQSKIEGTVWLEFIVEKDGSLTDIKVKKNIPPTATDTIQSYYADGRKAGGLKIVTNQDETCAEEAMRVVKMMPKWRAGKTKGKPVRSSYILPIKFKLE